MMKTRPLIRLAAALAATLLLGAACANDDGSDAAAGTGSTGTTVTGSTGGAGATGSTGSTSDGGGGGRYDYGSGGGGGDGDTGGKDEGEVGGDVEITLSADNFAFTPNAIEVKAGSQISIENANAGTPHTFTVEGTDIDLELEPGEVEEADVDLDPGTYDFHCRFHAVMTGTLTVT